jgi:predicted RNA-binding protein YlxR (DUF448 family)
MHKKPKAEMIRLGLDPETGRVVPDTRGRMHGRGGYACRKCLPELRFNRRIQRAFRGRAKELYLEEALTKIQQMG